MSHQYEQSEHRADYEQLAKQYSTTPEHVYDLAHGQKSDDFQDRVIYEQLALRGIVSVRRSQRKGLRERRRIKILGVNFDTERILLLLLFVVAVVMAYLVFVDKFRILDTIYGMNE